MLRIQVIIRMISDIFLSTIELVKCCQRYIHKKSFK